MPILQRQDEKAVRQRFEVELKRDVNVTLFTQSRAGGLYIPGRECQSCGSTEQLLEDMSALSPKIHLKTVDYFGAQPGKEARNIQRIPAIVVSAKSTDNLRFYGLPSGLEFAVLLDTIIATSSKKSALQLETRRRLKKLQQDIHIQVFVTTTCQFCPMVARLACAMAIESPRVVTDIVEIQEFPQLAQAYCVMSVPKTVINDNIQFTGALSENEFLELILRAIDKEETDGNEEASDRITPIDL